jgi:hypothetical protein
MFPLKLLREESLWGLQVILSVPQLRDKSPVSTSMSTQPAVCLSVSLLSMEGLLSCCVGHTHDFILVTSAKEFPNKTTCTGSGDEDSAFLPLGGRGEHNNIVTISVLLLVTPILYIIFTSYNRD